MNILEKIKKINNLISEHEEDIANPILKYLDQRKDLNLIGKNKIKIKIELQQFHFIQIKKHLKKYQIIYFNIKLLLEMIIFMHGGA